MSAKALTFPNYNDAEVLQRTYLLPLDKLDATAAPGVSDDDAAGYVAGSRWADRTNDKVWFCTSNATGAATWVEAGGGGAAYTDEEAQDAVGGILTDTDTIGFTYTDVTPEITAIAKRRPNVQTGTTYTYLTGDRGKLVTHTNAAAIAGTLPQAGGSFPDGWFMWVQNRGAGTLTITPTTSTIDGAATLVLTTGLGAGIFSDGTDYFTMRGIGGGGGGGDALTSDPLSQFAATTSLQLYGTIIDTAGTGLLVFDDSPSFSGIPTAPTAALGTDTMQLATTAFVQDAIAFVEPLISGHVALRV